ncbi:MAG: hypothetical protein Q8876_03435, partial [Bacillota bacterium]|nr:hypothetical protein [Bacillota bacterium]
MLFKKKLNRQTKNIIFGISIVVLLGIFLFILLQPGPKPSVAGIKYNTEMSITVKPNNQNILNAQVNTDSNGKPKGGTVATDILSYIPRNITQIDVENTYGHMTVLSYTPVKKSGSSETTEATVYKIKEFGG